MLHLSTVEKETYAALTAIFSIPEIKENFALAGGTSIALQLGHRTSIDLDIFTSKNFNPKELETIVSSHPAIAFDFVNSNRTMLFGYVNKIKCDFVLEPSILLQPFIGYENVNYFHLQDIAAMKMHTICGRGKKKDFFDIYALLEKYQWKDLIMLFIKKYDEDQLFFLWRSIVYFDDANEDPDIKGLEPFNKSWNEIKEIILNKCSD